MSTNGDAMTSGEPAHSGALKKAAAPAARSSNLTEQEIVELAKGMARYLRDSFAPELMERIETMMRTRQARLEERVRELEAAPFLRDAGIWSPRPDYNLGEVCQHDGSTWICQRWHRNETPGKSDSWRLWVKRGRDGRDAR